jgi:Ser/Thr protein kinase RdoA (MazF antagonist)
MGILPMPSAPSAHRARRPSGARTFDSLGRSGQARRLKRLGWEALTQYALPIRQLTLLAHLENTTFRAEAQDGRRFLLRISRPGKHTLEEVRSEMAWLCALRRETRLLVPDPVVTQGGDLATLVAAAGVPEPRICVVTQWVAGHFLNAGLTPQRLQRVGALTARLHAHAQTFAPPPAFTRASVARLDETWEEAILARVAVVRPPDEVALLRTAIQQIRALVNLLGEESDARGLIHADLHQENYLFDAREAGAIDFDDCGYGPYLYDLAVTLSEIQGRSNAASLGEALLAGYRRVRHVPVEHERVLPALMERRRIDLILWWIDSRTHPAFRDRWDANLRRDLRSLQAFVQP